MRVCPSCGRENGGNRDFCVCGEYLRWEPTQQIAALELSAAGALAPAYEQERAGEPVAAPVGPEVTLPPGGPAVVWPHAREAGDAALAAPVVSPGGAAGTSAHSATLVLRLPDSEEQSTGPLTAGVKPGERLILVGLIRNESGIVDNYDIAVRGLPAGWWTVTPATVYLVPFGTRGEYEQEVQVHVHPPRTPDAQAKPWPFEVTAFSRARQAEVASAPAAVKIDPYREVTTSVTPDRASGRFKARFVLTVRNRANATTEVRLRAEDADGECEFRFAELSVTIEPGRGVEAPFRVIPPRQIWIGRAKDRSLRVSATPVGEEQPQPPRPVTFRQRSWLPWWLAVVAPLVAVAAAAVLLLMPKQTVVPDLKGKGLDHARALLVAADLRLSLPIEQVLDRAVPPGSIVQQTPAAQKKVKPGSIVLVSVAVRPAKISVPPVVGLPATTAAKALSSVGLQLGMVSPPNDNANIVSQIPSAGTQVAKGTPVEVFLPPPSPVRHSATTATTWSTKPAFPAKPVPLPVISGNPAVAAQHLSQLGFVPTSTEQFSSSPRGTLVGTNPPAGTPVSRGGKVQLITSAGWPKLAYDDGSTIYLAGSSGTLATKLPASGQHQDEASWSPDGTSVVYVQGPASSGQLFSRAANNPAAPPRALTGPSSDDHDPAFAPTTTHKVLAYIDDSAGGSKLCLGVVGANPISPACTSHPGWTLGRQVAWSPDGTKILVLGIKDSSNGSVFGLIEFVSNQAFSTQASLWGQGAVVTDTSQPGHGVIAGAFSRDAKHIALVSNIGTDGFYVYVAPPNDFKLAAPAKALGVMGCQVAWRPDSQELAVMQADGLCTPAMLGSIVGVNPSAPGALTPIATQAENPAWQPLSLGG
jgi:beta-lactam-binding protein with PASTA domain